MSDEHKNEISETHKILRQISDGVNHAIDLTPDTRQESDGLYMEGWHLARKAFRAGEDFGRREAMALFAQFKLGFIESAEKRQDYIDPDPEIDPDELTQPTDEYLEGMEAYHKAYLAGVGAARERVNWQLFQQGFIDARGGFEKPQKEKPSYLKGWDLYHTAYRKGFSECAEHKDVGFQRLKEEYDKYKAEYERLVNHFAPIVITHPHLKPEGWETPDIKKGEVTDYDVTITATESGAAEEPQPTIPPDGSEVTATDPVKESRHLKYMPYRD